MAGLSGAELKLVFDLVALIVASVAMGGMLAGFVFSLTAKVWTHVADRLAEKLDAKRAEEVLRLKAECWRLRLRASKGGV